MAAFLGQDEMAYLKTEDDFERSIRELVLVKSFDVWRHEMSVAVANGIGLAFGGGR